MIGTCNKRKASEDNPYEGEKKAAKTEESPCSPANFEPYERSTNPESDIEVFSNDDKESSDFNESSRETDPKRNKAYGLRPRADLRKPSYDCEADDKEIIHERRSHRGRGRSSLMTKYRRRTANDRERHRMKEINDAFTTLRGILPTVYNKRSSSQVSMTKIRILRLAASYIEALSKLLSDHNPELDSESSNDVSTPTGTLANSFFDDIDLKIEGEPFKREDYTSDCSVSISSFCSTSTPAKEPANECLFGSNVQLNVTAKEESGWGEAREQDPTDREIISLLEEVSTIDDSGNRWVHQTLDEICFSLT